MSTLTYNDITLPYPFATDFSQRPVYEESKTDWYCTEFDISVQAVLSIPYLFLIAPAYVGPQVTSAAQLMNYVRQKLSQPRKLLSYKFNGTDLIPAPTAPGGGTVDVENGPKIEALTCTLLTHTTFMVSLRIKARYWEALPTTSVFGSPQTTLAAANAAGNPVLYNRWKETVEMDECLMSTRTREGKFCIRSDNSTGVVPDAVRSQMAVVGVPAGFNRSYSKYTQTTDGLGLEYHVVDREVFKHPPPPAYKAVGDYTETAVKNGALRFGEAVVKLWGAKTSSQVVLVEQAVRIVSTKIRLRKNATGSVTSYFTKEFSIKVGMYDNTVAVRMAVQFNPTKDKIVGGAVGFGLTNICYTPGSETAGPSGAGGPTPTPPRGPTYTDRGTAGLLLQAAAYYDPSLGNNALTGAGTPRSPAQPFTSSEGNTQMNNGIVPGKAGQTPES